MARPLKKPSDRKNVDVRIPLTEEQKKLVTEAAALEGADVATWLRPIVMGAVEDRIAGNSKKKK